MQYEKNVKRVFARLFLICLTGLLLLGGLVLATMAELELLPTRQGKLLEMAGIRLYGPSQKVLHVYWNDFSEKTPGLEMLVLRTEYAPGAEWECGAFRLSDRMEYILTAHRVRWKAPEVYEWHKEIDGVPEGEAWEAWYSDTGVLVLWRAHHPVPAEDEG